MSVVICQAWASWTEIGGVCTVVDVRIVAERALKKSKKNWPPHYRGGKPGVRGTEVRGQRSESGERKGRAEGLRRRRKFRRTDGSWRWTSLSVVEKKMGERKIVDWQFLGQRLWKAEVGGEETRRDGGRGTGSRGQSGRGQRSEVRGAGRGAETQGNCWTD